MCKQIVTTQPWPTVTDIRLPKQEHVARLSFIMGDMLITRFNLIDNRNYATIKRVNTAQVDAVLTDISMLYQRAH